MLVAQLSDLYFADIPGCPGYQCNRAAQFRSLPRQTAKGIRGGRVVEAAGQLVRVPRILTPQYNRSSGRMHVHLVRDGHPWFPTVAQVVALTFHGPCPPGQQVCHQDENKWNNWAGNLEYATGEANRAAFLAAGRHHNSLKECCPRCGGPFTVLPDGRRNCLACKRRAEWARWDLKRRERSLLEFNDPA